MLKTGNGETKTCVGNLMRLTRGEVHLDQLRGIRADLIDQPATTAAAFYSANVRWMIDQYEPRAEFDSLNLADGTKDGYFTAAVTIK